MGHGERWLLRPRRERPPSRCTADEREEGGFVWSKCIRSPPARAGSQDIELAGVRVGEATRSIAAYRGRHSLPA